MKVIYKSFRTGLPLLGVLIALTANYSRAGIIATATFTDTQPSPGVFQYDITLNNTGTTTIGTFWFSWIPGAGFLSSAPNSILSPTGWSDVVTNGNAAIQWTTTSSLLNPGNTISGFQFDSIETPSQLLGTVPSGLGAGDSNSTSFVYIAAPLGDPGYQLVVNQAAQGTPEPGTIVLSAAGLCAAVALRRLKAARISRRA